jgi:uncharacterized protein YecT (DUF1311 family)
MRYHIIATTLLVAFSSPSVFAKSEYSAAYSACTVKSGGNTSALSDCSYAELVKQNARMDEAYKSAITVLPVGKMRKLQEGQALWVKFRKADCSMYYSLTGGTMDLLEGAGCELRMTLERADTLEWFAENGAGEDEEPESDAL